MSARLSASRSFERSRLGAGISRAAGFTLLELLIATTVSAIVLLVINATFFGALRLHNTTHERIDRDLAVQRSLGIIRRDLAGIMLPGGVMSGQLQTDALSSSSTDSVDGERVTPDIYTNSGPVDGWTQFGDVQMVSYYLTPDPDGGNTKTLVRIVTRNLLPVQDTTGDEQTLLPGVLSAAISYYDGTDWTDSWDSTATSTLPSAIKFSLVLAPPDAATNPAAVTPAPIELVVPVMVMTPTSARDAAAAAAGT